MKLLALDTSSVACSVAVRSGEATVERHEELPREHTRILVPMLRSALAEANLALHELDAIVLGNGPGSFIGMRIGAAVAQGLAHGAKLQIVPVSSLAAVAAEVFAMTAAAEVVVAQDAHMHQAYLGFFAAGANGLPEPTHAERIGEQAALDELASPASGPRFAAGHGWHRYPDLLAANRAQIDAVATALYPRAEYLLGLGAAGLEAGAGLEPKAIDPAYLRQKVAEKPAPAL